MTVVKSCGRRTPSKLRFKVRSMAVAKDPDERYSTTGDRIIREVHHQASSAIDSVAAGLRAT
jgi:hypothetical protein